MFNCLTKLPKFECLKNLGNNSLPNLAADGTVCTFRGNEVSEELRKRKVGEIAESGERQLTKE